MPFDPCHPHAMPDYKQIVEKTLALFAVYTGATLSFFFKDFLFSKQNLATYHGLGWLSYWGTWCSLAVVALLLRYIVGSAAHLNYVYVAKTAVTGGNTVTTPPKSDNLCLLFVDLFVPDRLWHPGAAADAEHRQRRHLDVARHLFHCRRLRLVGARPAAIDEPADPGDMDRCRYRSNRRHATRALLRSGRTRTGYYLRPRLSGLPVPGSLFRRSLYELSAAAGRLRFGIEGVRSRHRGAEEKTGAGRLTTSATNEPARVFLATMPGGARDAASRGRARALRAKVAPWKLRKTTLNLASRCGLLPRRRMFGRLRKSDILAWRSSSAG